MDWHFELKYGNKEHSSGIEASRKNSTRFWYGLNCSKPQRISTKVDMHVDSSAVMLKSN